MAALYETADGRWMQLNMIRTEELFDQMVVALEAIDMLTDERFATPESRMEHGDALTILLREVSNKSTAMNGYSCSSTTTDCPLSE